MNLGAFLFECALTLVVFAIVIHHSEGRISRNEFWKIKLAMFISFIAYWILATVLFNYNFGYLVVIGFFLTPVFFFKWMQVSIQRLHDLNYSGWMLLFEYVPLVNLYFLFKRWLEHPSKGMNDYDVSIAYADFLKKSGLYPTVNCIELKGLHFRVNSVDFEYRKHNGKEIYECSKLSLDEDQAVKTYCEEHLEKTENAPSYAEKYKVSFLKRERLLENMKKDLKAVLVRNGCLVIDEKEVFIRKDGFSYMLVYDKDFFIVELEEYTKRMLIGDYTCVSVTKEQLKEIFEKLV